MTQIQAYIVFVALLGAVLIVAIEVWRGRDRSRALANYLQGAVHSLIRNMENDPPATPGKLARGREAIIQRIAIEGGERLKLLPATTAATAPISPALSPMGYIPPTLDSQLTAIAQELLDRNEASSSDFWFKAQGIRTGIQAFLAITQLGNPAFAYLLITDHMKRQRDEWEGKKTRRSPNFTELKLVLGLPTEWPEGSMPEQCQMAGISHYRTTLILTTMRRYGDWIFANAVYKPWPRNENDPETEFIGKEVLAGMREYIR